MSLTLLLGRSQPLANGVAEGYAVGLNRAQKVGTGICVCFRRLPFALPSLAAPLWGKLRPADGENRQLLSTRLYN